MTRTIIILGAGWAGLPLAHKILKYTVPRVKEGLRVILVSPSTHFFWNVAATRGIIPGTISQDQLFLPIEPGFSQYSAPTFEFVEGKARSLDPDTNSVSIFLNNGTQRSLSYDQLVIATGSQSRSNLPFKGISTYEETLNSFQKLQTKIQKAKSIVIGGAGPTGVEVAGELAAQYGDEKDITLIISEDHVLQSSPVLPSVSQSVERDLHRLGVNLIRNAKVRGVDQDDQDDEDANDTPAKRTRIILTNGQTLFTDLYLPLFGVAVNTNFVPSSLLDEQGNLVLEKTMRVAGTSNIWGIGDVGNMEAKQLTVTDAQIIHLSDALDSVLTAEGAPVKEYKPSPKVMVFIALGKKYAAGQIGGWKLWGWLVAYVKGRKLFVDTAPGYVGGKHLRHASM